MKRIRDKFTRKRIIIIAIIHVVVIASIIRFFTYVNNYYEATDHAKNYIEHPAEGVTVRHDGRNIIYEPENPRAGFIFYPGALVQTEAYAPVLEKIAENGIEVIEIGMPHYIAIFKANGARGIIDDYPEIEDWYIGGHSLGGAMANMYAKVHVEDFKGIILMASFSINDFSDTDLKALSLRGSEDGVLKMDKYEENLKNLPKDYKEVVIQGGCHSYFGDYGIQDGDGNPTITCEEQTDIVVDEIVKFIE
ncbi:Alpha/beta hydrolase family protein [Pseudobutyrivibrio sp. YE44]|uniref:alpha/beta fold hydrolase n=1 Tax=Pseudobutyrivibrio sp. YE44 TaxID=1520802 RepID=UPI00088A5B9C|nr:alpha/beta fold hydrolase [Pseudobutyrivibrio sp. YE44]SDB29508.1 Alpha/beta hydrolase family protein [Pseudobutyrivibrio sp. YE44]